jgi:two-component system CheB/CheR fusion protein
MMESNAMESNAALPPLVLVADDNAATAGALALLLRLEGYRPVVAYDGPSALACALAHRPHVAILDLGLPRLAGCAIARQLRATPGLPACLLIALTGHGLEHDRQLCRDAGFDHFLLKPAAPDEVLRLLPPPRH